MKKLLKRIGFLDSFTIELKISSNELMDELNKKTDKNNFGLFDIFRNDKNEYVGRITKDKFEIKRWNTIFISFEDLAKAYGKIKQENDKLIVDVDVYSIRPYSILIGFGLITIMFFLIGLAFFVGSIGEGDFKEGLFGALGLWGFALIFVGLPLFAMRFSVSKLRSDIETDLKNIEKKKRPTTIHISNDGA